MTNAFDRFTMKGAINLVQKEYSIDVTEFKVLDGYIDKNLWLKSSDEKEYVMRIKLQSFNESLEQMIEDGLVYLNREGFQVPMPITSFLEGKSRVKYITKSRDNSIESIPVQVARFIPGKTVYNSSFTDEELYTLSWNIGAYGGSMQRHLTTFSSLKRMRRDDFYIWYTENFPELQGLLHFVDDIELRTLIKDFVLGFEENVSTKLPRLRQGFVHGDYSNTNIVVVNIEKSTTSHLTGDELIRSLGTIDFEYFHHGYIVFSLTVCMAYMMTQASIQCNDPLVVAREVLQGYLREFPLTKDELDVVFWGVVARLCTTVVMASRQIASVDVDVDYVTCASRHAPALLRSIVSQGRNKVTSILLNEDKNTSA